jgi:hypothetical protein
VHLVAAQVPIRMSRDRVDSEVDTYRSPASIAGLLCGMLGRKPRLILRAIRRIEAAASWARERQEGRQREAANILAAQASQQDQLGAIAALSAIASQDAQPPATRAIGVALGSGPNNPAPGTPVFIGPGGDLTFK